MKTSILIPHYKNGKATSVAISQILKCKGRHEVDIIVIDNSGDRSIDYVLPFLKEISIVHYPKELMQSHGIAFDWVVPHLKTEEFITIESDSLPTTVNWLDYYEFLIDLGYDAAGSVLDLSGGQYMHPCGAFFKKSIWEEARLFVDRMPYSYFPNAARKEDDGFEYHLMVHDKITEAFIRNPTEFVEPASGYKNALSNQVREKLDRYLPTGRGVFHNGMYYSQESIKTYGQRNMEHDSKYFGLGDDMLIFRVGLEPGQFLSYWMEAMRKKVYPIPTLVKWMEGRGGQNQEYTMMENGFKHIWGLSSYHNAKMDGMEEVIAFKKKQCDDLYDSLPENEKIPAIADGESD